MIAAPFRLTSLKSILEVHLQISVKCHILDLFKGNKIPDEVWREVVKEVDLDGNGEVFSIVGCTMD